MDLRFKVNDARTEQLPLGVFRKMKDDPQAMIDFAAHYLVDESGSYLVQYDPETGLYAGGRDDAYAVLDPIPLGKLQEIATSIQDQAEEAAVPKE